jgi:hypothetical protein
LFSAVPTRELWSDERYLYLFPISLSLSSWISIRWSLRSLRRSDAIKRFGKLQIVFKFFILYPI